MKRTAPDGTITEGTPAEFAAYDRAREAAPFRFVPDPAYVPPIIGPVIIPSPTVVPEWLPPWQVICGGGIPQGETWSTTLTGPT